MKLKYMSAFLMLLAVAVFVWMPQTKAQISGHDYTVQWSDASGNVITNALYNAVTGDTAADGSRKDPDRVYILLKGGVYWNTETFKNNGYALRFVGQTPDPTDIYGNPPTLQMVARSDGSVSGVILSAYGDVYMKNIYIIGSDNNGVQTYYEPMNFSGNNYRCTFDSCIFERSNFAIPAWNGTGWDITFTNCTFLNMVEMPVTQQWTGRDIMLSADEDSCIVENCTFVNTGCFVLQPEGGTENYLRFDHNTMFNVGRQPFQSTWWKNAYFANNLFINPFFQGEGYNDYSLVVNPNRDPRAYTTGMLPMGALPAAYGPDLGRRILFANSAAFLAQTFKNAWDDTVRLQPYFNAITDSFFNTYSPAQGGQMVVQDTMWLKKMPNFTNYDTSKYPVMIQSIEDLRKGITPAPTWFQDLQVLNGDTLWTAPQWPLVQNFTYTDQDLMTAGTDGLPLGDLNWFPAKKADFEANKAKYIKQMQDLAGAQLIFTPVGQVEAEDGTVGGGAAVKTVPGITYYNYNGAGSITWTFNVTQAGLYDTRWFVNNQNNGTSGPCLAIDGTQFVDKAHGWGQFVLDPALGPTAGLPTQQWIWMPVVADSMELSGVGGGSFGDPATNLFTLSAGQHTIGVEKNGWGNVQFSEVDVVLHGGTDTLKLKAPDAVPNLVTAGAVGAKWVASGFKYVNMGTNGTDQMSLTADSTGTYKLNVAYQNYMGATTAQISVDGSAAGTVQINSKSDSSGTNSLSSNIDLSAGTHTFTISGTGFNLDFVQLVRVSGITGIKSENQSPYSYQLEQNYPNPFNPSTNIRFSLAAASNVKLIVYNVLGQKVVTLIDRQMRAGVHSVHFNAINLASGVYFYGIETKNFKSYKKMILLK